MFSFVAAVGQRSLQSVREVGYHFALLVEGFYWLIFGRWRRQPVRLAALTAPWLFGLFTSNPAIIATGTLLVRMSLFVEPGRTFTQ